jgi:hypothetical protein
VILRSPGARIPEAVRPDRVDDLLENRVGGSQVLGGLVGQG